MSGTLVCKYKQFCCKQSKSFWYANHEFLFQFEYFWYQIYFTDECFEKEIDYPGNDIAEHNSVATPEDCQVLCQHNDQCIYWTYGYINEDVWYAGKCFLKNVKSNVGPKAALTSGPRNCPSKLYTRGELSPGPGLGSTQVKYIYCNGQDPYLIETEVTLSLYTIFVLIIFNSPKAFGKF